MPPWKEHTSYSNLSVGTVAFDVHSKEKDAVGEGGDLEQATACVNADVPPIWGDSVGFFGKLSDSDFLFVCVVGRSDDGRCRSDELQNLQLSGEEKGWTRRETRGGGNSKMMREEPGSVETRGKKIGA